MTVKKKKEEGEKDYMRYLSLGDEVTRTTWTLARNRVGGSVCKVPRKGLPRKWNFFVGLHRLVLGRRA